MTSRFLVRAAVYAALYAALTLAPGLNTLAYGPVQFRVSEVLMVFACFDPAAVAGLAVGCAIANLGSPMMPLDVFAGAALTLVAAGVMYAIGPRVVALAVPVVVNGLGVAAMLALVLGLPYLFKGDAPDHIRLMERREEGLTRGHVPPAGLILVAAADVQMRGIWVEIIALAP